MDEPFMVSPAYDVFEITKPDELLDEYLMMWFSRAEFDRNAWFHTDADVRGGLPWSMFCSLELPIPSIEKQREIVKEYNTVVNRIKLNEQLNQNLEETAQAIFESSFSPPENENRLEQRLGDLIEIKGGFSYHSSDIDKGGAFLLGMGCISFTSRFVEEGMRPYSNDFPEKHKVTSRDIVIATRQQSENMPILGVPAMIPPDLCEQNLIAAANLYKVINKSDYSNYLLYQLLRSTDYIENIKLNTKGTTVGMITKDAIEDYCFRAPSDQVIATLNKELQVLVDHIFTVRRENKNLNKLKGLILSKMTQVEVEEKEVVVG
jgi:type I restriction enzyme, S subunit